MGLKSLFGSPLSAILPRAPIHVLSGMYREVRPPEPYFPTSVRDIRRWEVLLLVRTKGEVRTMRVNAMPGLYRQPQVVEDTVRTQLTVKYSDHVTFESDWLENVTEED